MNGETFTPKLTTTDWNAEWIELQKSRKAFDDPNIWNARAKAYNKSTKKSDYASKFIEYSGIEPGDTAFDMGCGTGAISVPLAKAGHHVIAADFSEGMLDVLRDTIAAEDVKGIEIVQMSWADNWAAHGIMPKSVDVATASRSIATSNLEESLDKLISVARKRCAITLPTATSPRVDPAIIAELGLQRLLGRDFIYAFMILANKGYLPEVRLIPSERLDTFESEDEAYESLCRMVDDVSRGMITAEETEDAKARLHEWLKDNLIANPNAGKPDKYGEVEGPLRFRNTRKVTWAHLAWNVE